MANISWADGSHGHIPDGAIVMGFESSGEPLYAARAHHSGALLPGKYSPSHGCAYVSWNGDEHRKDQYQILVGGSERNWVATSGGEIPNGALKAGETEGGEPLYLGRADHEGSRTPGKVQRTHECCYIPYDGKEVKSDTYDVYIA